jgi:tetratricopeptide (TPR) repeat protein
LLEKNYAGNDNYVVAEEYPYALKHGKTIVAVEAEPLDRDRFNRTFPQGVSHYITIDDMEEVFGKLLPTFDTAYLQDDNARCYLLGMAFMKGIMVERDVARAVELLELAAGKFNVNALKKLSQFFISISEFGRALHWLKLQSSVVILRDNDALAGAKTYEQLGFAYFELGDIANALEAYKDALNIYLQVYGKWHKNIADVYSHLSAVYIKKRNSDLDNAFNDDNPDLDTAVEYAKKAIDIRERLSIDQDPTTYINCGDALSNANKHDEALDWFQKAINLLEQRHGEEYVRTAAAYMFVGRTYIDLKDFEKAEKYIDKAYRIQNKLTGPNSIYTLSTLNQRAFLYQKKGDYQKALNDYYYHAEHWREIFGTDNMETAEVYMAISNCLSGMGEQWEAIKWRAKIIKIFEHIYGSDHPNALAFKNSIEQETAEYWEQTNK